MLAKTAATGHGSLLPEVLALTSSLERDRALLREDLAGSLAHLIMLARARLIPAAAASSLKAALVELWTEASSGELRLPDEEDVHMAVEAELGHRIGEAAGHLHTARSRNDQVALDLRLHLREAAVELSESLAGLVDELCSR